MNRKQWKEHHDITDIDMELIEIVVGEGGKVTDIFNKPLDYSVIKYTMNKSF